MRNELKNTTGAVPPKSPDHRADDFIPPSPELTQRPAHRVQNLRFVLLKICDSRNCHARLQHRFGEMKSVARLDNIS